MSELVRIVWRNEKPSASFFQSLHIDGSARSDHDVSADQRLGRETVAIVVGERGIDPHRDLRELRGGGRALEEPPLDVVAAAGEAGVSLFDDVADLAPRKRAARM